MTPIKNDMWIHVDKGLPPDRTYVLVRHNRTNWHDKDDQEGTNYRVVKFVRGLSKIERNLLADTDERKRTYCSEDEGGNNLKPYYWTEFGPGQFFGQEVDLWKPINAEQLLEAKILQFRTKIKLLGTELVDASELLQVVDIHFDIETVTNGRLTNS